MRTLILVPRLTLIGVLVWLLSGCHAKPIAENPSASVADDEPGESWVSYSAKNGLLVSAETAQFIGLEMEDVTERPIRSSREVNARIFRAATPLDHHAFATAIVPAADASRWQPQLRSIQVSSPLVAEVMRVATNEATRTGTAELILRIDDPGQTLREGGFLVVRFAFDSTNAVTAVPASAVLRTLEGDFVYLENGIHIARAAVKTGRTDGKFTEVTDGLLSGDRVVVRPVMTLWMTELHHVNGGDACCVKREPRP